MIITSAYEIDWLGTVTSTLDTRMHVESGEHCSLEKAVALVIGFNAILCDRLRKEGIEPRWLDAETLADEWRELGQPVHEIVEYLNRGV